MIDRYILEIVWKKEYGSFVDEFDRCSDKFEIAWKDNDKEDEYLYQKYIGG